MSQDFAKKRNAGAKSSKKKPAKAVTRATSQPGSHWSWFFSGLFSGLLICVVGYYALIQLRSGSINFDEANSDQPGAAAEDSGTDLQFYEFLPQAEVEVSVVQVEIAESASEEANPTTYFLQAGSFLDPNDAEELRARLILMNMNTIIYPTELSGRTWYRVQSGPFMGRSNVEAAENVLRQNNIDPMRLRSPSP